MAKDKDKAKAASKARADAARAAGNTLPTAGKYPTKAAAIVASQGRGNAVRATRPPVKSTTKKAAANKGAPAPGPLQRESQATIRAAYESARRHGRVRPTAADYQSSTTKKAADNKKAAKIILAALSEARGNVAGPRPTAPKYATKEEGIAASRARGAAARKAGTAPPTAGTYPTKAAAKAASRARGDAVRAAKKAATAPTRTPNASTSRDLQQAVNKMGKFKTTEADPHGWASIAKALGDAGDKDFRAYKSGRPGTSEARKYVKAKQAKATKSGRGPR